MQQQIKRPIIEEPVEEQEAPKNLLAEVPDISSLFGPPAPPKRKVITRCAGCSDPNCRVQPVDVEVEE